MKKSMLAVVVLAGLSACGGGGGGGGDSGNGAPPVQPAPVFPLSAYIGTWAGDCADHEIDTVTVTRPAGSSDTISLDIKTEYFSAANCTGTILATETQSAGASATYAGTIDSSIVFTQGATAVAAKVDRVTASLPQHTRSIVGPGVVHTVVNGQAQWCIDYGGGSSTCIRDDGTYPAQTGVAGGLHTRGNEFFELSPSGSVYVVNQRFTKK
jgi:hypothetical protein